VYGDLAMHIFQGILGVGLIVFVAVPLIYTGYEAWDKNKDKVGGGWLIGFGVIVVLTVVFGIG
jgi:hypothetical protein